MAMQRCSDVMTKDPAFCLPADTVDKAAKLMKDEDVGLIPVVQDKESRKLIGTITDRDLALRVIAERREFGRTRVEDVMSMDPVSCHPDDNLTTALDLMAAHKIRRMPVVDKNGMIAGIISQADVATRLESPQQAGQMVRDISRPS